MSLDTMQYRVTDALAAYRAKKAAEKAAAAPAAQ
jgi:hypothetical protein